MEEVIDRSGASSSSSSTVIHSETTLPEYSAPSNKRKQLPRTSSGGKCYRMQVLHCRSSIRLGSSSNSSDDGIHVDPDLSEQDKNPVQTAIGNAYNALDEAKDFAEEALKVAESAFTAARDAAASARALLGALALVQQAVESVQEAIELNAIHSGDENPE
jgi:hypothetical protein